MKRITAVVSNSPTGQEVDDKTYTLPPLRRYIGPVMFLFLNAGIFFYWSGFVLVNTYYTNEYPFFTNAPPNYGFVSARYNYEWWTVWFLTLNALLIIILCFALINNTVEEVTRLHKWLSLILVVINLYVAFALLFLWIFWCNNGSSGGAACNDYRWCCVNFPSVWCPNTIPCTPAVTVAELHRNDEMTQHFIFAFVFFVLSTFHAALNGDLREFKLLY
jgi:hypothetical protein